MAAGLPQLAPATLLLLPLALAPSTTWYALGVANFHFLYKLVAFFLNIYTTHKGTIFLRKNILLFYDIIKFFAVSVLFIYSNGK